MELFSKWNGFCWSERGSCTVGEPIKKPEKAKPKPKDEDEFIKEDEMKL